MTVDAATWVVAGLQVATAVGIVAYWQWWLRSDHDIPWWPPAYEAHERAFVLPDHVCALVLTVSAFLSVSGSAAGGQLALIAAGMMLFLGLIDLAYFARHQMFAREHDGVGNALIVGWMLFLAVVLAIRFV